MKKNNNKRKSFRDKIINNKKFYKRKIVETWGSMSKDKVGLYKNSRVLLYEGRNVIMSDFY